MRHALSHSIPKASRPTREHGFVSIEVLLAAALFGLFVTALSGAFIYGQGAAARSGDRVRATALAAEGLEVARNLRDAAYTNLTPGTFGLSSTTGVWALSGSSDVHGIFTRTLSVSAVDSSRSLVSCTVSWPQGPNGIGSVVVASRLTNWQAPSVAPNTCNGYAIEQGYTSGVCRQSAAQCTNNSETNLPAGDLYCTTNQDTVCCAVPAAPSSCSGTPSACTAFASSLTCVAQTGCSWGSGASGSSSNPSFDSNTTGWTYADWQQGGGINVTGVRVASGGNPNGYVNISIPGKKGDTSSGYWEQSFAISQNSPTGTVSFDWRALAYSGTLLTSFNVYVFVDSAPGAPTLGTEVWSATITSTGSWQSVSAVNISSKIPTAGTYYLKVAARRVTSGGSGSPGTNTAGFDNVQLDWSTTASCGGTPNACTTYSSQASCQAISGCSWN